MNWFYAFMSLYSIITNICYAGWSSTFGLAWYCSISCFTYSSNCQSVRFNGNHETTSGEHVSSHSLSFFFLQGKAKLLLLTDRRSFSKEYTSYFQVSATHDWLLLTICPIRINNLLVSFSQTISMNSFIVIKFLFFIFLP